MIFGLGRGKIDIHLEKFNFSLGETIKGKVSFELKKPIQAKQLRITLAGLKTTTYPDTTPDNISHSETEKNFIYKFDMPLDGKKEYLKGEYPFEIKIPADILQSTSLPKEASGGALGTVLKAAQILSTMRGTTSRIEWYIETSLSIPGTFDIKKKININIG